MGGFRLHSSFTAVLYTQLYVALFLFFNSIFATRKLSTKAQMSNSFWH